MNKNKDSQSHKDHEANPFVFDVGNVLRTGAADYVTTTGTTPVRIGPTMIAYEQGSEISVTATLTPLGEAVMVDATINGQLTGECVRCLAPLSWPHELHVNQIFAASEDFITGDDDEEGEADEPPMVDNDKADLTQSVIDEAGLNLPFNPTCQGECANEGDVPAPDGISGEEEKTDPRWAGLEKFL